MGLNSQKTDIYFGKINEKLLKIQEEKFSDMKENITSQHTKYMKLNYYDISKKLNDQDKESTITKKGYEKNFKCSKIN